MDFGLLCALHESKWGRGKWDSSCDSWHEHGYAIGRSILFYAQIDSKYWYEFRLNWVSTLDGAWKWFGAVLFLVSGTTVGEWVRSERMDR